jgi:hypothetical protein
MHDRMFIFSLVMRHVRDGWDTWHAKGEWRGAQSFDGEI